MRKCADLQCAAQPMLTAPGPRDRAFPTPRKPPARLPGQGGHPGHVSLRKSHQVGVSLVRQKPKTSEKAVVSGWDGQAQSTALEFKSQTPKTASSVGLSLLTLQVPASTPSSPPASALKRQMLNWTALCARHCSKRGAVLSPHQLVVLLSPNCHPGRVPGGQC